MDDYKFHRLIFLIDDQSTETELETDQKVRLIQLKFKLRTIQSTPEFYPLLSRFSGVWLQQFSVRFEFDKGTIAEHSHERA